MPIPTRRAAVVVTAVPVAWIVVGLGYGDEGKGSVVDALTGATGARLVVRFNGGPQAAHHFVRPGGMVHCFSQVGSGAFFPGVTTFLSRWMFVDPLALDMELQALRAKGLADIAERIVVDPDCPIVTPYHGILDRMLETVLGQDRHGSCGRGIGELFAELRELTAVVIRLQDLTERRRLGRLLTEVHEQKVAAAERIAHAHPENTAVQTLFRDLLPPELPEYLVQRFEAVALQSGIRIRDAGYLAESWPDTVIFEGAQGALLDAVHGFWPHVTPSRTTVHNALALLSDSGYDGQVRRPGVVRAYATRHGEGPLVTETPALSTRLRELHDLDTGWQGPMRVGWLDLVALRYAIAINGGIDGLAMTCIDRLVGLEEVSLCDRYLLADEMGAGDQVVRETDEAGVVTDIVRREDRSPDQRLELTRLLARCAPGYRTLPGWDVPAPDRLSSSVASSEAVDRFVMEVGCSLGCGIHMLSRGPTAEDTQWIGPLSAGRRHGAQIGLKSAFEPPWR